MGAGVGRDAPSDETLAVEAAIAARIGHAVARADFSEAPRPDFSAFTPDPHQVLTRLAEQNGTDDATYKRLAAALAEQRPVDAADKPS